MNPSRSEHGGFSLVELLVTMTLSVTLLGILAYALDGISRGYVRSQDAILSDRESGLALDLLMTDLECMVIPRSFEGETVEALRASPFQTGQVQSTWLTFLSRTDDKEPNVAEGVVRAVSYRIALQDPIDGATGSGQPSYSLYRTVLPAQETFDHALSATDSRTEIWENKGLVPDITSPIDYLVGNVVDFRVRFITNGFSEGLPSNPGDTVTFRSDQTFAGPEGSEVAVNESIVAVEVAITVLSQAGAEALHAGMSLSEAIERFGNRYTRQTSILPRRI